MYRLLDRTTQMGGPLWDVVGDAGMLLGRIAQTRGSRQKRTFFAALGPDGCDLGRFAKIDPAIGAVVADAEAGWPRSPRNPVEKYREIYDGPALPLYPMGADDK